MVLNTALMNALSLKSFEEARADHAYWGRVVESSVGAHLLNSTKGTFIELFYWREKNLEVDFVLKKGDQLIAIEVKGGYLLKNSSGLALFDSKFKPYKILVIGASGISLEHFFETPLENWFK